MASVTPLTILWSDANYVAVFKPAGLATIPGRAETDSVLEQIGRQLGIPSSGSDDPRIRVVHRLDKGTSGVLLFALNRTAQQHVSHQFQNNTISKEYVAIVRGNPTGNSSGSPAAREGVVDAPLAPHPASNKRMCVAKHGGRPARTEWRIEESFRGFALVRCFPKTGKTHQIRVHMAHLGTPLAIDPLYAAPRGGERGGEWGGLYLSQIKRNYRPVAGEEERPLIDRLTLHAEKLSFVNLDGSTVLIEAPLPKDFRAAINQLRRNGRR